MSDRIRQLENALSLLHSDLTCEPHPLLTKDLLQIKSIIELHCAFGRQTDSSVPRPEKSDEEVDKESQYFDAFGTFAIRDDGAATFYGRSAGSEVSKMITTPFGINSYNLCFISRVYF
jgi:hypothetical protein